MAVIFTHVFNDGGWIARDTSLLGIVLPSVDMVVGRGIERATILREGNAMADLKNVSCCLHHSPAMMKFSAMRSYISVINDYLGSATLPQASTISTKLQPADPVSLLHNQQAARVIEVNASRVSQVIGDDLDLESWRNRRCSVCGADRGAGASCR